MKKAVIFDMDGTLWDTTPLLFEVWNRVMQNYEETRGRFLSLEEIRSLMGKTMYEIGELTMPGVPEKRMEEIFNGCIDAEDAELIKRGGTLYPGCIETLQKLKENYDLYIVSNGQEKYAANFISFYGFEDLFRDKPTEWITTAGTDGILEPIQECDDFSITDEDFEAFKKWYLAFAEKRELLGHNSHLIYLCRKL